MSRINETELYVPIKSYLESQGFEVKSEVANVDIVARKSDLSDPVLIEMKASFSLTLFHQGVDRQSISDLVYIAVPRGKGRAFMGVLKRNIALCRRLGLGLITVRLKDGFVEAHLDPAPYKPRRIKARAERLLREFSRRVGDPNTGGVARAKLITAYRQDALRCAVYLNDNGPTKAAMIADNTGVENARRIMSDDHYGWFERVSRGVYMLTPFGVEALGKYDVANLD